MAGGPGAIKGEFENMAIPAYVLYVAAGDPEGSDSGKVYQVNEHGRVLGWVNLPYTPTGIALHRDNGLVVCLPRDGGRVVRIDDTGKPSTLLEKDKTLVHPVDVAVGGESDSIVVADNIADVIAATTTGGTVPKIYDELKGQKWTAQDMSVAVTRDKHVLFGTNGDRGIFRLSGDSLGASATPLLPEPGGVAADPKSLRWAATQAPNEIYLFEGEEMLRKIKLPPNKRFYRNGLLSFSPAGNLVAAARDGDEAEGDVWFFQFNADDEEDGGSASKEPPHDNWYIKDWATQDIKTRSLFPWKHETMNDFVVGPRMFWDRNEKRPYESTY
jgi:hypothetical protein